MPAVSPTADPKPAAVTAGTPASVDPGAGIAPRRRVLHAALVIARPRQWVKNLLVIAAAGAAGAFGHDHVTLRILVAFVAFCLLASGAYALNDVRDVEEDRRHPRKRSRPVAAGELEPGAAVTLGVSLMCAGLCLCFAVRPLLGAVGAGYLALTLSYTVLWRRIVVLDVLAIACGFLLRAVAGGVAAPVTLSRWFIAVVMFAALFVATGKRQAEARRAISTGARRQVLRFYTPLRLRALLLASAGMTMLAYCVWALQLPSVDGIPWRLMTIGPFGFCLLRYGALVRSGDGEAPEELLLRDHWLQLTGLVWLVVFGLGVHAAG